MICYGIPRPWMGAFPRQRNAHARTQKRKKIYKLKKVHARNISYPFSTSTRSNTRKQKAKRKKKGGVWKS